MGELNPCILSKDGSKPYSYKLEGVSCLSS